MTDAQIDSASVDELRAALRECRVKRSTDLDRQEALVRVHRDLIATQEKTQIEIARALEAAVSFLRGRYGARTDEGAIADILAALAKELRLRSEDRLGMPRLS